MIDFLIYGKIIIDDIRLDNGQIVRGILGGGGPQAALGARLWHESVGLLSRSGTDIEAQHVDMLKALDIDLQGWHKYTDIPTPKTRLVYDDNEYMVSETGSSILEMMVSTEEWYQLLAQPLTLPPDYGKPRLIHLITEFHDEPMVETALSLQKEGVIFALEPLIDFNTWRNRDEMMRLIPQVDLVTPDWPSASGIAGSDDPAEVMDYWSTLGPKLVAIRDGARGSYVWDAIHGQSWHIPIVPVEVVDPTGAGNSYGGGLSIGWAEHGEARLAGCYGAISAKFLIEQPGPPKFSNALQKEARRLLIEIQSAIKPLASG
ncbi:MAG: PfkB family carbohydrate kinase [Chloroflexota bacterium]